MFETFSPNMLKTFEKCPRSFYYKYVQQLSMPVNYDIFTFGKNIHALASYFLKGETIEKMESSLTPKETDVWKYLKNIEYFKYKYIGTEYNLSVMIGKHFFGGRLDALVKDEDTYYILDYKTGSIPKDSENDLQTIIYLLAVRAFFNTDNVNFVYIDLKNKTTKLIKLTAEMIPNYEHKLNEIVTKIDNAEFKATKNNCKNCEYGKICYEKLLD